jgi:hypothetical protein
MTDFQPKQFVLAGIVMKLLISGEQTGGLFCLLENRSAGQTKTPIHVHAHDDETIYVVEGHLTAVLATQDSTSEWWELGAHVTGRREDTKAEIARPNPDG